ncbi:MAG: hypothetical protein KF852_17165 [Saprospiraceae bacterium]|nr:hypothetical protein [Saprospiraceae bacterium]
MKKFTLSIMAAFLMLAVIPAQLTAATATTPTTTAAAKPAESEIAGALLIRLHEINDMDKANLSSMEKKELRKEVRAIKTELKAANGVYLSVGAIIIIVLLLILLL